MGGRGGHLLNFSGLIRESDEGYEPSEDAPLLNILYANFR